MGAKAKVVLTDYVWDSLAVETRTLDGVAELVALKTKTPEQFLPEAADCDALLNTYAGPITAEAMARMPKCKIIARYGIGVDTIDLEAATAAGIIVTNNPTYCIEEVAEHTMALLLACARKTAPMIPSVRARPKFITTCCSCSKVMRVLLGKPVPSRLHRVHLQTGRKTASAFLPRQCSIMHE